MVPSALIESLQQPPPRGRRLALLGSAFVFGFGGVAAGVVRIAAAGLALLLLGLLVLLGQFFLALGELIVGLCDEKFSLVC
ncbi:hypothetical protein [Hydrocarboniphaga sp.]|uniref:hypothetical protein n=1 Tax=Hydrocarboniphaga sp. TaxID=2033016 RepID=UPI0026057D0B|nr:hypothetical protein [Hydrocarboniphaga sp.]